MHLLILIIVQEQLPQCRSPVLHCGAKVLDTRRIHKKAEKASCKGCCDSLISNVKPIKFQAALPEHRTLPNGGQAPLVFP